MNRLITNSAHSVLTLGLVPSSLDEKREQVVLIMLPRGS